jgi:hypothetical protein
VDLKAAPAVKKPTIALGYCWNEARGVSGFWHQSVLRLLASDLAHFRPIGVEAGPAVHMARNQITRTFLGNEGDDYLLFTDTDMVFDAEDVKLLLEADASIAGATYYNAATGEAPWCTALVGDGEMPDGAAVGYVPWVPPDAPPPPDRVMIDPDQEETPENLQAVADANAAAVAEYIQALEDPKYGPTEVAAVGMGLTLIRRDVLEDVSKIYNYPFEFEGRRGEDLVFCLRAAEFDHKTVVVPKARVAHIKTAAL